MPVKIDKKRAAALQAYYDTLVGFAQQYALHEGAVSVAFQTLLADTARSHHWTLIPQLTAKGIRPDGTLKDPMGLVRGHWEAKDTKDDLDIEIGKKTKKGYSLANIIFEDTRRAVLIQNKNEVMRIDLSDREQLSRLLDTFFAYVEPQIESFEKAVDEFKERVPDIAKHLKAKIEEAHNGGEGPPRVSPNKKFIEAFATFMEVCRNSLNPNISQEAVDDMLVQHLLTERLIREIFDNPEFTRRNVIAAEIEKVIAALTSKSFDRKVFLKSLDRFYVAIENAARTITEWSDKQHFLNTVYERFFQGYSVKLADTMGIVYTPQPIVDFMCASVVEVLEKEFGKTLGDRDVNILDPCTGTGNFIVNLLRRVPKKDLPRVYKEQLFANEIMLLPYYIAALNIEHAYYEQTGEYESFEGLCFVDTLDLAESHAPQFSFMTAKNTERVERQKRAPITIIIGNPPYNMGQREEQDNNKNRSYPVVDFRIRDTYAKASKASLKNKLYDPYVKFFRWGVDRLGDRDGIVCLVTNNSFIDQVAFDGFRSLMLEDFSAIYHVDLHGNVRENPKLSGSTHNVFGIQVGVGITVAVKRNEQATYINYHRVDEDWRREVKLAWLASASHIGDVVWRQLRPDAASRWLIPQNFSEFGNYVPIASKETKAERSSDSASIFSLFSLGVATNRDDWVYSYDASAVETTTSRLIRNYNSELNRFAGENDSPANLDEWVNSDQSYIKWTDRLKEALVQGQRLRFDPAKIHPAQYRPFVHRYLYFDGLLNQRRYQQHRIFPTTSSQNENAAIIVGGYGRKAFSVYCSSRVSDLNFYADPGQCFPFYAYDEDGTNRRENITDWSLDQFRTQYKDESISKWDIFHYVYGVLHHPGYRTKFADNLKRELPRIPFAPDFRAFATAGAALTKLHLDYEKLEPWPLKWIETPGEPLSYHVEKMKLSKDKTTLIVNTSLTLADIPPDVSQYRLGNRSALEWVIDQYQISEDKRSGIKSDPNREDDEEYIVRLVGQVVRVSIETVKIVNALPEQFAAEVGSEIGVSNG